MKFGNPSDPNSSQFTYNRILLCVLGLCSDGTVSFSRPSLSVVAYSESVSLSSNISGASIRYTIDGTDPNSSSLLYEGPLYPSKDFVGKPIKAISVTSSGQVGPVSQAQFFFPVVRTEQNVCYTTSTTVVACDSGLHRGQDGLVQSGKSQSYSGPNANSEFPSDITTTDLNTGLVWQTCNYSKTGLTCTGSDLTGNWSTAVSYCSSLNSMNGGKGYANLTGWRLPSIQESYSLLRQASPSISSTNFPNNYNNYMLTATSDPTNPSTNAYAIGFVNQVATVTPKSSNTYSYRCVTGSSHPSSSLADKGDGTLFDSTTGRYWTKCLAGEGSLDCSGTPTSQTWLQAVDYCSSLTLASKTWRMPNINELIWLINPSATTAPYVQGANLFTSDLNAKTLLSSSTWVNVSYPNTVVAIQTNNGQGVNSIDKTVSNYSLCVSGP
ncbi:DUF1566 domain-containing protein [Leptospira idonii]|uniref:Lcl domain-containing protein n=1 Tax=Leptospira idonii TaxID=1193500 RepID=UPI00143849B6|nr:DUF1566 domain-containing protein [Leptospira idonii]